MTTEQAAGPSLVIRASSKVRRHYPGCYRLTLDAEHFAQIVRRNDWQVEIRKTESGDLLRYAGAWRTRQEAIEEAMGVRL